MPHTVGSKPVGICAPTVRDRLILRGTRISVPALRMTCQSLEPRIRPDHRVLGVELGEPASVGLR